MHNHSHSEHTQSISTKTRKAFVLAIFLNSFFVVVEFIFGFITNSTALIADAGHNLSDVLGLLLAWIALLLSHKIPKGRYTYGLRSTSILAALANAILLLIACGAITWEAIERFSNPPVIEGLTVSLVAGVGIIVNSLSAWLFMKDMKKDLNVRGAYLHMVADAAVSFGVVLVGITLMFFDWYWIDPLVSLVIVIVIVVGTWGLLKESLALVLNAAPNHINLNDVEAYLRKIPEVKNFHDLHIWGMSTTESALTVHLVMPKGHPGDEVVDKIAKGLEEKFRISHTTIQIENGTIHCHCALSNQISHQEKHDH